MVAVRLKVMSRDELATGVHADLNRLVTARDHHRQRGSGR